MPKKFSYPAKIKSAEFDLARSPERGRRGLSQAQRGTDPYALSKATIQLIKLALREDIGPGDITSKLLIPKNAKGEAQIISKSAGIFSGKAVAQAICKITGVKIRFFVRESAALKNNQKVMILSGKIHAILKTERVLLNLIGHLSGIAAQTAQFVNAVRGTKTKILDTRKTTPLWRELEKGAVLAGGGFSHRLGLFDYILVKENHRRFGNLEKLGIKNQEPRTKKKPGSWFLVPGSKFEIEVRDFDELIQAFDLGAEVAMLDHFSVAQTKTAVKLRDRLSPNTALEASGNMTPETVRAYAQAGVDSISVGALTHSVPAHDFSLLIGDL